MEIISASGLEWTTTDVEHFRAFLETQTGKRVLPKLAESAPRLLPGGETNDILTRAGSLLGFQAALQAVLELLELPQAPARSPDSFPNLDDDAAWPQQTT